MKTTILPASHLYIYAYPAQMITFQLINNNKIYFNENCTYEDTIRVASRYLKEYSVSDIFIVGETIFADKIGTMIKDTFNHQVNNIERIKNA